jgi:predicted DNA-binding transcriptional regulator AlpA
MEQLLTIEQAAALLQIKPRSLYELTSRRGRERTDNPIPVIRLNAKTLRFRLSDLEEWIAKQVSRQ